jgi:hypothetical protein
MRVYFEECRYMNQLPRRQFHAYWEWNDNFRADYVEKGIKNHFSSVRFFRHSMGIYFNFSNPADKAAFTLILVSGVGIDI